MRKSKIVIISITLSLFITSICAYTYNKILNNEYLEIYIVDEYVYENERISDKNIKKIKVKKEYNVENVDYLTTNKEINNKYIARVNLQEGQVLTNKNIIDKLEINKESGEFEHIAIELKNISSTMAYQLEKGDKVNVYFNGKQTGVSKALENKGCIYGSDLIDSNVTCKILNNARIIDLYNLNGESIYKSNDKKYAAAVFRVSAEQAMLISNIKEQGVFSITLLK